MSNFISKNDKQINFNFIKGTIEELNDGEIFCNLTVKVGHENPRLVNLVTKKHYFQLITNEFKVGDKVKIKFYISSRQKNGRWYTMANILNVTPALQEEEFNNLS